jgi:nitrogen-specific signal transduction histidine kinase
LEISDNGIGMSKAILSRLFDPFFSTKSQGRGLGMPVVMGIVKAHKGTIIIDSILNKGTKIQILLPPSTNVPGSLNIEKNYLETKPPVMENEFPKKPLILVGMMRK